MSEETKEIDFTQYVEKPASALQEHLTEWIKEQTGVTFGTKKEEAAFDLGVKLTVFLRMRHQASDENQERLRELAEAREARASAAEEPDPEPKPAKVAKAKAAKAAPKVVEAEAVVRPAKKAAKRAPKAATGASSEAPF